MHVVRLGGGVASVWREVERVGSNPAERAGGAERRLMFAALCLPSTESSEAEQPHTPCKLKMSNIIPPTVSALPLPMLPHNPEASDLGRPPSGGRESSARRTLSSPAEKMRWQAARKVARCRSVPVQVRAWSTTRLSGERLSHWCIWLQMVTRMCRGHRPSPGGRSQMLSGNSMTAMSWGRVKGGLWWQREEWNPMPP